MKYFFFSLLFKRNFNFYTSWLNRPFFALAGWLYRACLSLSCAMESYCICEDRTELLAFMRVRDIARQQRTSWSWKLRRRGKIFRKFHSQRLLASGWNATKPSCMWLNAPPLVKSPAWWKNDVRRDSHVINLRHIIHTRWLCTTARSDCESNEKLSMMRDSDNETLHCFFVFISDVIETVQSEGWVKCKCKLHDDDSRQDTNEH